MRVLSSKRFFIPKTASFAPDGIQEWFDGIDRGVEDCTLVVTLQEMGTKRWQKKTAARQLEELIVDNAVEWEGFGYRFYFSTQRYSWNNTEIHVTANEALFLYRWLVLLDDTCQTQKYYLHNMRRRLGKAFLAEVV
jgi:hypothetical protein